MRKKCLAILFILFFAVMSNVGLVYADGTHSSTDYKLPVTGGYLYFDEATGTITDCDIDVNITEIPETINGITVVRLGNGAFRKCKNITISSIPDKVTELGSSVFTGCDNIKSIDISQCTSIGDYVFSGCDNLNTVILPENLTEIPVGTFGDCTSLKSIDIPDGVKKLGKDSFWNCVELRNFRLPESLERIEECALYGMEISILSIPKNVEYIDVTTLELPKLSKVYVSPQNSVYISVNGVLYSKDVKELYLYPRKKSEEKFVIPDTVEYIRADEGGSGFVYKHGAFYGNEYLKEVVIGKNVSKIGYHAFAYCSELEKVIFRGNAPEVDKYGLRNESVYLGKLPTLYYYNNLTGFATPKWKGYDCYPLDESVPDTYSEPQIDIENDTDNVYVIVHFDSKNIYAGSRGFMWQGGYTMKDQLFWIAPDSSLVLNEFYGYDNRPLLGTWTYNELKENNISDIWISGGAAYIEKPIFWQEEVDDSIRIIVYYDPWNVYKRVDKHGTSTNVFIGCGFVGDYNSIGDVNLLRSYCNINPKMFYVDSNEKLTLVEGMKEYDEDFLYRDIIELFSTQNNLGTWTYDELAENLITEIWVSGGTAYTEKPECWGNKVVQSIFTPYRIVTKGRDSYIIGRIAKSDIADTDEVGLVGSATKSTAEERPVALKCSNTVYNQVKIGGEVIAGETGDDYYYAVKLPYKTISGTYYVKGFANDIESEVTAPEIIAK